MLRLLSDSILSVIYPQECHVCGDEVDLSENGVACSACWQSTRVFDGNQMLCTKCGAFLFGSGTSDSASCGKCVEHSYDRSFSAGLYEKALAASILELKKVPNISRRVKRLIGETLSRFLVIDDSSVVIPVPLSIRRLRERGFNQATIIGKIVSSYSGLDLDDSSLIRTVHTPMHRAGMDRKARAITVKNAFKIVRPKLIQGKNVLLVDDILTSGETASNCAKILKKNGASTVKIFTIACAA